MSSARIVEAVDVSAKGKFGGCSGPDGLQPDIRTPGHDDSQDAVRRNARSRQKARAAAMAEAYVPLPYPTRDAYQFDWSHEIVLLAGMTATVAHVRLCHSHMMFVQAYPARDAGDGDRRR